MSKSNERGAVLITTLFITALASLLAATIAFKEHLFFSSSVGIQQWQRAYQNWQLLTAKVANSLTSKGKLQPIAYLKPLKQSFSIDHRRFHITVSDAQGHYNINRVTNLNQVKVFTKLLVTLKPSLPPAQALAFSNHLRDWIQLNTSGSSSTDSYYLRLTPPYYPTHAALSQLSEIKLVKGFSQLKIPWSALQANLIALPSTVQVNRHGASASVLSTVTPGLSLSQAQSYLACVQNSANFNGCDARYLSQGQLNATVNQTRYFLMRAVMNRPQQPPLYFSSLFYLATAANKTSIVRIWQRFSEN